MTILIEKHVDTKEWCVVDGFTCYILSRHKTRAEAIKAKEEVIGGLLK